MTDERYTFATSPESAAFVAQVADELVNEFGIGAMEALGRINNHWRGMTFVSREEVDTLTHETPSDWARIIYYGADVDWWDRGAVLVPVRYP